MTKVDFFNSVGSTWLRAMWSFIFIPFLFLSCSESNETEDMKRLTAEVYGMHTCQLKADNLNFYLHKYNAEKLLDKYENRETSLTDKNLHDFLLARGRFSIVYSDYLLQIGNKKEAIDVIDNLSRDRLLNISVDTLLWLNYLTHQGRVNYYPYNLQKYRSNIEKGYDCLVQCYIFASRNNKDTYKAVSMQLLSQYLLNDSIFMLANQFDPASVRYINEEGVPDSLLAGNLAERALRIFLNQKDFFYTANAWRSLARCYFHIGDAHNSIECLNNALANPVIDSMPDLKASISEQMSMSYAALNDKHMSDYYRNQYLDLQDSTRQDRQLEARLISLEKVTNRIWFLVIVASVVFILLCMLTFVLVRMRRKKSEKGSNSEEIEIMDEDISALRLRYSDAQRSMVEQRARVSIIKGMLSLIERMNQAAQRRDYEYVRDIANDIDHQNEMLTGWIKLSKGDIKPRIEDFPIADVLSIVEQSASTLATNNISLKITGNYNATVKADKILTLFIINTLIDNARKSMRGGGEIIVNAETVTDKEKQLSALRIDVEDNGKGMSETQIKTLFEIKPIQDDRETSSHGFGLQNCKGIIECYRKISHIFSICSIGVESQLGKGTKVSFSIPLVKKMLAIIIMMFVQMLSLQAKTDVDNVTIERFADSLYQCNVQGRYEDASVFADSCKWFTHDSTDVPEGMEATYLSIYNETAVTALALHQWHRYMFYNHLYANLYKLSTQDKTLLRYCSDMERGKIVANISMFVVLLLIVSLFPILWYVYLRPMLILRDRYKREKEQKEEEIARLQQEYSALHIKNNIISNQLSSIKHETMYYPARIKQLLVKDQNNNSQLEDIVTYYSSLYSALSYQVIADDKTQNLYPIKKMPLSYLFGTIKSRESKSVIANEELMRYLLVLLKRNNNGIAPQLDILKNEEGAGYISLWFAMSESSITQDDISTLFANNTPNTDYLVMRQIVREIADASNSYASGINVTIKDSVPYIVVILPTQ